MGRWKPLRASERVLVWSELHTGEILSGRVVCRELVPWGIRLEARSFGKLLWS